MTEPTLKSELSQLFFTTIEMVSIPFYKIIAVVLSFLLLGSWKWEIVGIGTLFAMVYVGVTVRLFNKQFRYSNSSTILLSLHLQEYRCGPPCHSF